MSRRLYTLLFAMALFALLLAACQPVNESTPSPEEIAGSAQQVDQQVSLIDSAWSMVSYGVDEEIPVVPDSYPSLNFLGQRYTGYTGCNFFMGSYLVQGNELGLRWPALTQGACEDTALLQQQETFLAAITAVEQYEIDGDNLYFYVAEKQVMTLEPLEPVPFEGTTWNYKFLQTEQAEWLPIIPGTSITAVFEGDTVAGSAGCNDYDGTVTRDDEQMTISNIVSNKKMCAAPEGIMEQETLFLEKLQTTGGIQEYARSFELRDTKKLSLMLFSAD